jgi:hypothetical protein
LYQINDKDNSIPQAMERLLSRPSNRLLAHARNPFSHYAEQPRRKNIGEHGSAAAM